MRYLFFFSLYLALCLGSAVPSDNKNGPLDRLAEDYVRLALEVGAYAPGYIDAYYGPKEWIVALDDGALRRGFPAAEFRKKAGGIVRRLDAAAIRQRPELEKLRVEFLRKQMVAVQAQIDILSGRKFTFDRESSLFYDAIAPVHRQEEFEQTIAALEAALPGPGSLAERLAAFKNEFVIPAAKLPLVFDAALAECRRRTLAHIALPAHESFRADYVRDKPWGAYNWYRGNAYSVIEVNTDLPMHIDAPLRLASHEGYPGHHVYNALLEQKLTREKGWKEFTVYPLFSPQSFIAEGTANCGLELLFPGEERLEFEKKVLYPLAGLDAEKAGAYARVQKLLAGLRHAENEAARAYLDKKMSAAEAQQWMERYALESPERAAKSIDFWNAYRSYVINYTLGEDIVRAHVERTAGPGASLERKWQVFYEILTTPRTPSGLSELGVR
jgi:hypothetical protein